MYCDHILPLLQACPDPTPCHLSNLSSYSKKQMKTQSNNKTQGEGTNVESSVCWSTTPEHKACLGWLIYSIGES